MMAACRVVYGPLQYRRPASAGVWSLIDAALGFGRVAVAGGDSRWQLRVNARYIFGGEGNEDSFCVLVEVFAALGADDGDNVLALGEQPREGKLRLSALLFRGNFFDSLQQGEILLQIFSLKPRRKLPVVVLRDVCALPKASGEEAAA